MFLSKEFNKLAMEIFTGNFKIWLPISLPFGKTTEVVVMKFLFCFSNRSGTRDKIFSFCFIMLGWELRSHRDETKIKTKVLRIEELALLKLRFSCHLFRSLGFV